MTSPAKDRAILAFIEARLDEREALAYKLGLRLQRVLLAEAAKDRAILALHRPDHAGEQPWCVADGWPYPCQTVRLLAAIDADHPDFDPDWKPVAT